MPFKIINKWFLLSMIFSTLQAQAQYSVTLPFKQVTVEIDSGKTVFSGASLSGDPGRPQLPVYRVTFLLPPNLNCNEVKVTINSPVEKNLDGAFDIQAGGPLSDGEKTIWPADRTIVDGKDAAVYNSNSFYPASNLGQILFAKMRQYQLVEVMVYPYKYNPVTRKLRMITGGTLEVVLPQTVAATSSGAAAMPADPLDENYLKNKVANFQAISAYGVMAQSSQTATPQASAVGDAIPPTYVIVTPVSVPRGSAKLNELEVRLAAAGYQVVLFTENNLPQRGATPIDQRADFLRGWLQANYLSMNIRHVLIISNPDPTTGDFPMKIAFPKGSSDPTPTDYYFAELSGNWDINGNGLPGEYTDYCAIGGGGPDNEAEVAVGRIPYYGTIADIDKILQNSLDYQRDDAAGGLDCAWRASAILAMGGANDRTSSSFLGENIKYSILDPNGISSYRLYTDLCQVDIGMMDIYLDRTVTLLNPLPEQLGLSNDLFLNVWNKGFGQLGAVGLIVWWAHGNFNTVSQVLNTTGVASLTNAHPAIIFSTSCSIAEPEHSDNLAYALLKSGAAASLVAATREATFASGDETTDYYHSSSAPVMAYNFTKSLIVDKGSCGSALNATRGLMFMLGADFYKNLLVLNLFGCPHYEFYLPPQMPLKPTNLSVQPVSSTQVTLSWTGFKTSGNGVEGYDIYKVNDDGSYTSFVSVSGAATTTYAASGLQPSTKYRFAVRSHRSFNGDFYSDFCAPESTGTNNAANQSVLPYGPGAFWVSYVWADGAGNFGAQLAWASSGADCYVVKRSSSPSGPFVTIANNQTALGYTAGNLCPGETYYFTLNGVNAFGQGNPSAIVSAKVPPSLISLPGRVEAEDYSPTEGTGYHDLSVGNTGGVYRNDDVDIEATQDAGGGYDVGWTQVGEWLSYNVNVASSGPYDFTARMASGSSGTKTMIASLDGTDIATFTTTDASGWQSWKDVAVKGVNLSAGNHTLRMTMTTGGFNLNYVDIAVQQPGGNPGAFQFANATYSVAENGGSAVLTVNRVNGSLTAVTVNYATANGTATSGSDYTSKSGTLNFADGVTSQTISVPIIDDAIQESNETFTMTLSNATGGATLGSPTSATVTIVDNDAPPPPPSRISLPGRIQAEDYKTGGEGVGYHDLTTGNTGGAYRTDNVDIEATSDAGGGYDVGWTQAGEWLAYDVSVTSSGLYDFTARMASGSSGTKTMTVSLDGTNIATFTTPDASGWQSWKDVVVKGVNLTSGNHALRMTMTTAGFNLNYLNVAAQAPTPGALQFSASTASIVENGGSVTLTVNRVNGSSGSISVNYATANGTALSGSDYTAKSGTLTFVAGVTSQTITVPILDDAIAESNETFTVSLSNATGGATLGSPASATVTITDNDAPVDLARGKTATASSQENTTNTPDKAFDGNASTRWSSAYSDPQWIRVDLGATYTVKRVVLTWETASAKNYQVQVSSDGTNWTTLVTKSNMATGARTDNLTGLSGTGRYVRMYGTARNTTYGYSLYSFEVYNN